MKKETTTLLLIGFAFIALLFILRFISPHPVVITSEGVLPEMSLDQKIFASELILIGEVMEVLPSKWNTLDDVNTRSLSTDEVRKLGFGVYTDAVVVPRKILKGETSDDFAIRVRTYTGTIEHVTFSGSMEPVYQNGQMYLFLLRHDWSPNQYIDPGYYMPVNAGEGAFLIENEKAISIDAEWTLDELVDYIEESRWSIVEPNIPEVDESQEVADALNHVYDIETKAGYDFDTSYFSSIYINDPRFLVVPEKLEYTRHFNDSLSSEVPGYLDYKIAYFHWWPEGIAQNNNSEWKKKWGNASGANLSPVRERPIRIVSIEFSEGYVTVYLHGGYELKELYLVKIDGRWYVAGEKGVTTIPVLLPEVVTDTPTFTPTPGELLTETPTLTP